MGKQYMLFRDIFYLAQFLFKIPTPLVELRQAPDTHDEPHTLTTISTNSKNHQKKRAKNHKYKCPEDTTN